MADFVRNLIAEGGYFGVALLMLLETVFPPIPSEVIMGLAGFDAANGGMSLPGAIIAGTLGAMAGNILWYVAARWIGIDRFEPFIRKWGRWFAVSVRDIDKGKWFFDAYGAPFVLFARMLPTVRSLVSVPAGLMRMNRRRFVLYSTVGTAGWTGFIAFAGYTVGQSPDRIEAMVGPASTAIVVVLLGGYIWRVATWKER